MTIPSGPHGAEFVVLGQESKDATSFRCGLCGTRFTHGNLVCTSCPMNAGCEVVKCPQCGYQFPRNSRIVDWGRKLIAVWRSQRG